VSTLRPSSEARSRGARAREEAKEGALRSAYLIVDGRRGRERLDSSIEPSS
jgi:hypothetical protein